MSVSFFRQKTSYDQEKIDVFRDDVRRVESHCVDGCLVAVRFVDDRLIDVRLAGVQFDDDCLVGVQFDDDRLVGVQFDDDRLVGVLFDDVRLVGFRGDIRRAGVDTAQEENDCRQNDGEMDRRVPGVGLVLKTKQRFQSLDFKI